MKKLLLILITAVVGLVAHADKTIYYDNSNTGWTTCKITYWKTGDNGWSYDKKDMTAVSGATNIWKFSVPDDTSGILFTNGDDNGENQTEDCYDVQGGHLYKGTKNGSSSKCSVQRIGVYNGGSQGGDTYTIYFYADNENDMEVYCYVFGASDITTWGQLPKMTDTKKYVKIGDNDYRKAYSYTFTTTVTPTNVIFNSAKGDATRYTGTCNFSNGMFYHKVANAGVCEPETQTLVDKGGVDPDPTTGEYTVYFYDKKALGSMKTHIWGTNTLHPYKDATEAMTPLNKYVYVGGQYYPVYKYSFDWDQVPSDLLFYTGNGDNKTADRRFLNNGFYTNDNENPVSGLSLVDKPAQEVVTIYMHWKEDFIKNGNRYDSKGEVVNTSAAPYCHIFVKGNFDNAYKTYKSDDEKMYLVNETYQIWGYDIPKNDVDKYSDVQFVYNRMDGSEVDWYKASNAGSSRFDQTNWWKFIYTVHGDHYCAQTYLSYDEFTEEIAKGYHNIYVTGGADPGKWDGLGIKVDENASGWDALNWKPAEAKVVNPDTPGNPLFFIQLHPYLDNKYQTSFKLSWMNTNFYKNKNGGSYKESERDWATYDLGIIGVDDIKCESNKSSWGDILDVNTSERKCYFKYNKANPLLEYNQYDWVITSANMGGSGVEDYYCVVDMHPECRTVTLCTFNPQPSVSSEPGTVQSTEITAAQAMAFHDERTALRNSDVNGHVMFEKVNYLTGNVTVGGSAGVTQTVINNANFNRTFSISLGDTKLFDVSEPAKYSVDFLPVDNSAKMNVSTLYTSNVTHLTFHSRTGEADVTAPTSFVAPVVEAVENADYTLNGTNMRAYAKLNVSHQANNLNIYTDYEVASEDGKKIYVSPLAHQDDEYTDGETKPYIEWNKCPDPAEWNRNSHDWSSKCVETFNNIKTVIPLFINNALTTEEVPNFKTDKKLPSKNFTVSVDVVYPVLYSAKPTVTKVATANAVAHTAAAAGTVPHDLSDYGLTFYRATGSTTISTKSDVTGIEDVEASDEADAPAEYYTISGVRVNGDLAPGIYVVRRGNKVTKEVVK